MPPKQKYTDPKLRDQVKEELKQSDKGGAPGQWSARKVRSTRIRACHFLVSACRLTRFREIGTNDGQGVQKPWRRL